MLGLVFRVVFSDLLSLSRLSLTEVLDVVDAMLGRLCFSSSRSPLNSLPDTSFRRGLAAVSFSDDATATSDSDLLACDFCLGGPRGVVSRSEMVAGAELSSFLGRPGPLLELFCASFD